MGILFSVQGKEPEGGIDQVDISAKAAALELLGQAGLAERLELRIACRGLPKKDLLRCVAVWKSGNQVVMWSVAHCSRRAWVGCGRQCHRQW